MRGLDSVEVTAVAGGDGGPTTGETMMLATAIGSGVGASIVISANGGTLAGVAAALGSNAAITVGGAAVGGLAASGLVGVMVGNEIYDGLPESVQDYIGGELVAPLVENVGSVAGGIGSALTGLLGSAQRSERGCKVPPAKNATR